MIYPVKYLIIFEGEKKRVSWVACRRMAGRPLARSFDRFRMTGLFNYVQ